MSIFVLYCSTYERAPAEHHSVASDNSSASFHKAGHDDVKDAIKTHGLDVDWTFVFKDGQKVDDHREDHNAVDQMVKRHL